MSENLTVNQLHVLSSLVQGSKYGLEILKFIKDCGGLIVLGSLYNVLSGLEKKGFVESFYQETVAFRKGNRRRYYKITAAGESALESNQRALMANWGIIN